MEKGHEPSRAELKIFQLEPAQLGLNTNRYHWLSTLHCRKNKKMINKTETKTVNYLKIWLNHFCTSLLPVSSSLLPVCFNFLPVYFQSTSSLLPVYFQFSSRLQPTSKSTFLCQFFSFYELWAISDSFGQYILFWLICLKPYSLKDRYHWLSTVHYRKNK